MQLFLLLFPNVNFNVTLMYFSSTRMNQKKTPVRCTNPKTEGRMGGGVSLGVGPLKKSIMFLLMSIFRRHCCWVLLCSQFSFKRPGIGLQGSDLQKSKKCTFGSKIGTKSLVSRYQAKYDRPSNAREKCEFVLVSTYQSFS